MCAGLSSNLNPPLTWFIFFFPPGPLIYNAIRAAHPTTPILILGGHTHIRDCRESLVHQPGFGKRLMGIILVQFDGRSMSLESGRYMETIGWMSAPSVRKPR